MRTSDEDNRGDGGDARGGRRATREKGDNPTFEDPTVFDNRAQIAFYHYYYSCDTSLPLATSDFTTPLTRPQSSIITWIPAGSTAEENTIFIQNEEVDDQKFDIKNWKQEELRHVP